MVPIDFMLNFNINSQAAAAGVGKIGKSFQFINQTYETLKQNIENPAFIDMSNFDSQLQNLGKIIASRTAEIFKLDVEDPFSQIMGKEAAGQAVQGINSMSEAFKNFGLEIEGIDATDIADNLLKLREDVDMKTFEKFTKNLDEINNISHDLDPKDFLVFQKMFEQLKGGNPDLEAFNKELDKTINKTKKMKGGGLKETFSDMFGFLPTGGGFLRKVAVMAGAYNVFADAATSQSNAVKAMNQTAMLGATSTKIFGENVRRTDGAWQAIWDFTNKANDVAGATTASTVEASQAMGELAKLRVSKNIDELGEMGITAIQMGQAFDMSSGEAAKFIQQLKVIGGVSIAQVKEAANAMADVQDKLGLTGAEASEVVATVSMMTRQMSLFGGSVKHVDKMTKEVAKLVSTFKIAGLEASEAGKIMTDMMDPTKIEENILLYQGLGMSAQDAIGMMSGDGGQLENMNLRMIDLAKNLKKQYGGNVFALQAMAEAHGMSLAQIQQLSKVTKEQLQMDGESADLAEQAANARRGMNEQLQRLWNSLSVIMQKFVMPLLNILSGALEFVLPLIQGFADMGDNLGVFGRILQFVIGGLLLILLLKGTSAITGMVNKIPMIGQAFQKVAGVAKGALSKIGGAIGKFGKKGGILSKVGDKISGVFGNKNVAKGAQGMGKAQKSPLLDQLSKLKPQQILAVGAAMLMIAAGVALIILSMSVLMKAMKGLTNEEIIGGIAILVVVMVGMIIMLKLLGQAAQSSAPQILAVGAAMLMMGMAIAVVILAMALLLETIKGMSNEELIAGIIMMVIVMGAMIAVIIILGIVGQSASVGIIMVGVALLIVALAILVIAVAIAIIILAFNEFLKTILSSGDGFIALIQIITILIPVIFVLAASFFILGMSMMTVAFGAGIFVMTIMVLASMIPLFLTLGWAVGGIGLSIFLMGLGFKFMAENIQSAMDLLVVFAETMNSLQVSNFGFQIAEQLFAIVTALLALATMAPIILMVGMFLPMMSLVGNLTGGGNEKEDPGMQPVVDELMTANTHLNSISEDGKQTNELLVEVIKELRRAPRTNLGFNFGK